MRNTDYYNMLLPEGPDRYNVEDFNDNVTFIDGKLYQHDVFENEGRAHMANTSNPHNVTKSQVGLGNVENKSSATIRSEITKLNVTNALGHDPSWITPGAGLVGSASPISGAGTLKADLKSETKSTLEAAAKGTVTGREYAVGLDKNGDLSVNIPPNEDIEVGVGLVSSKSGTIQTIKAALASSNKSSYASESVVDVSGKQYAVKLDKNSKLSVNIPWQTVEAGTGMASSMNGTINTLSANLAFRNNSSLGGEPRSEVSGREYLVGLNKEGFLSVNVPWEKYNLVNPVSKGLAPALPTVNATSKYLRGDGTWDVPPGDSSSSTLTGLSDVSISSPTNENVLKYNSTTKKWVNGIVSAGGNANFYYQASEPSNVPINTVWVGD